MLYALYNLLRKLSRIPGLGFLEDVASSVYKADSAVHNAKYEKDKLKRNVDQFKDN